MKTFQKPILPILISIFFLFQVSCGDDESALNISSIKLSAEKTTILLGESIIIKATNQDDIDISDEVTIYLGPDQLETNEFIPETIGDLYFQAQYNDIKSLLFTVTVIENITELNFSSTSAPIKPIGTDTCFFMVTNQLGIDVTSTVDIYKEGQRYFSNYYVSEDFESVDFKADFFGIESNTFTLDVDLNPTTLVLSASKANFDGNGFASPLFSVHDEDNDDLTIFTEVYSGGVLCVDRQFTSTELGDHDFTAKYKSVESNVLTMAAVPRKSRKVLIEEFTGEWCGWCPMAAYNVEKLIDERDGNVLTAAIHNGDDLEYQNEALLRSKFLINYFPSGVVGRYYFGDQIGLNGPTLDYRVVDYVDHLINVEDILLGVDITTQLASGKVLIDVNVNFYEEIDEELRITIYLIENNVISGTQENYFSGNTGYVGAYYYDQPAQLPNFSHQNVLRKVSTDIYGEVIPENEIVQDNTYAFPQNEIDMTGYDESNSYVIAFVHYLLDGDEKLILNAEQVKVGESSLDN